MLAPMIIETCSHTLIMPERLETAKEPMLASFGTLTDAPDPETASCTRSYASFGSATMALILATMQITQ